MMNYEVRHMSSHKRRYCELHYESKITMNSNPTNIIPQNLIVTLFPKQDLNKIKLPVLVYHHEKDARELCSPMK